MFPVHSSRFIHRLSALSLPIAAAVCVWIPSRTSFAGETIAVGLASGRVFVGEVDPQTDNSHLWLRVETPGMTLRRPIDWDRVVLARLGSRELTSQELRAQADTLKSSPSENFGPQSDSLPPPPVPHGHDEPVAEFPPTAENLPPARQWNPDTRLANYIDASRANDILVRSISIDAQVANWNQTVETDGIVLHLYPLDWAGNLTAVDGTLDVELIAALPQGSTRGEPFPQIAHWTVRVSPDQFGPAGALFKLPFQGPHPEFDLNIGPLGLVHARLNVPGNGSFETSRSMVRIRQYSAVRDMSQEANGNRFFDVERVDRWGR